MLLLLALVGLAWIVFQVVRAPSLPGPWHTRLCGAALLYHELAGTKRTWIHALHGRYGPAVRIAPGEADFASPAAVRDIYVAGGGLVKTELYSMFEQGGARNLFTALGNAEHKQKKRRLADRYANSAVLRPAVLALIRERADTFLRQCLDTDSADVYFLLHCYALDCVSAVCFAPHGTRSLDGPDARLVHIMSYHDSRKSLVLRHRCPLVADLYARLRRANLKGGSRISDYAWSCMGETDLAAVTLGARLQAVDDADMPAAEKVAECLDHIGAGIDTTGDTLVYLLYELSQPENADRVERLSAELRGAEKKSADSADPTESASDASSLLHTLPYLDAVLQEALRLWAPGTLPLPRYVPAGGGTVGGFALPGGTVVSCQSYSLQRDESVFENAHVFRPERWLEDEERVVAYRRHLFAFGAGPRQCLGKNLAMVEMRALLYAVYAHHRTIPAPDMHYRMDMADQLLTSRPVDMCCKLSFVAR